MLTKGERQNGKPIIEISAIKDYNEIKTDRLTDEELEGFDFEFYELTKKVKEFKWFLRVKSEN